MTEDFLPYGDTPDTSFESQYKRLLKATGCGTQTALASVLEVRQSAISDAKRRKAVPAGWLLKLFEKKRINPDWVRTGVGPMRLESSMDTVCDDSDVVVITRCKARPVVLMAGDEYNSIKETA